MWYKRRVRRCQDIVDCGRHGVYILELELALRLVLLHIRRCTNQYHARLWIFVQLAVAKERIVVVKQFSKRSLESVRIVRHAAIVSIRRGWENAHDTERVRAHTDVHGTQSDRLPQSIRLRLVDQWLAWRHGSLQIGSIFHHTRQLHSVQRKPKWPIDSYSQQQRHWAPDPVIRFLTLFGLKVASHAPYSFSFRKWKDKRTKCD
jgi:hypothetical protein